MKPVLGKKKNARGRIMCHTATIGPLEGQGPTPALAIEAVEAGLANALARLEKGAYVKTWRGHTAIVTPSAYGWAYWIDTFSSEHTQLTNASDRYEAMGRALHHLAQNVWEPTCENDRAFVEGLPDDVAKEIAGWIVFQRSYAALRAEGKTDLEAHRLACRDSSAASV